MKRKITAMFVSLLTVLILFAMPVLAEESNGVLEGKTLAAASETEGNTGIVQPEVELPQTSSSGYTDVPAGSWYSDAVKFVTDKQICIGITETTFGPDISLTRSMLVTMMYRYAGSPAVEGTADFTDINTSEYYYNALIWGVKNKIITGYPDKTFLPNAAITREDVATILCRYEQNRGTGINAWLDLNDFYDGSNVSSYAKSYMQWAYSYGVMVGKTMGFLDPKGMATRAECATLIQRINGMNFSEVPNAVPSLFNGDHAVTYDAMCEYLTSMVKIYPNLIRVSSAGKSAEGRDVKLVTMGTGSRYIYMQGNLHAREYISLNYLLEILDSYAYAYTTSTAFDGYDVRSLLSKFTIVMIPCVNPDGQNIAINGINAAADPRAVAKMKNPSGSHVNWKANAQGVDLNGNFPVDLWTPSAIKVPANEGYRGPHKGSAPETQNVVNTLKAYPSIEAALDCHTAGNLLYYSDSNCGAAYKNRAGALATELAKASGYSKQTADPAAGAANYVRYTYGVPGITVELYPTVSYPLDCSRFTSAVWSKAKDFPLITMQFLR